MLGKFRMETEKKITIGHSFHKPVFTLESYVFGKL
jgi:hypothetical protein